MLKLDLKIDDTVIVGFGGGLHWVFLVVLGFL